MLCLNSFFMHTRIENISNTHIYTGYKQKFFEVVSVLCSSVLLVLLKATRVCYLFAHTLATNHLSDLIIY